MKPLTSKERAMVPWSESEDAFLVCPIPSYYLAVGALRGRSATAVRARRRELGLSVPRSFGYVYRPLSAVPKNPKSYNLDDFADVDWSLSLDILSMRLRMPKWKVCQIRKEIRERDGDAKPHRSGRRGYSFRDFPGVDWSSTNNELMEATGLSRPVVYRLVKEWKAANL